MIFAFLRGWAGLFALAAVAAGSGGGVLPAHTKAHLYFCNAQRTEHSFGQSARTFEHGAEDLQRDLCLFARLGGLVCLGGSGGGLFAGLLLCLFPLALGPPCGKLCLDLAKAPGRLRVFRCGRRLRLRVLEHREGDAQRTGLYGEHAVLPAQVCAEGAQQQQHQ